MNWMNKADISKDELTKVDELRASGKGDCGTITIYKDNDNHYVSLDDGSYTNDILLDPDDSHYAMDYVADMILDDMDEIQKQSERANWTGVDALNIVGDNYDGQVSVIVRTHFQNDEGRFKVLTEDANDYYGDTLNFDTYKDAASKIDEIENESCVPHYSLSHNEYAAPDYYIVAV